MLVWEAQTHLRHQTWTTLTNISTLSALPCLRVGDCNEVLHPDEHQGVGQRSNAHIQAFRDALDVCMLIDLGYKGNFWTFEKKVTGGTHTRCRLDRALVNASWLARFLLASVKHLTGVTSDHEPLLLEREVGHVAQFQKTFRYETMWETMTISGI